MKPLPFLTRAFGQPIVALLLCGWFLNILLLRHGSVPEVMVAGCLAFGALRAWRRLRIHRAWLRQWQDAGELPAASPSETREQPPARLERRSRSVPLLPLLLVLLMPLAAQNIPHDAPVMPLLGFAWLGCVGWCIVVLLQRFRKPKAASALRTPETDAPVFVSWVAGTAVSAPSRESTTSELPAYALKAMTNHRFEREKII